MDVRAAAEAAKAKTIHEDLMDKAKDIKELQQKMRGYIKELELEVERVGVGNTGRSLSKQYLEFITRDLNSTKQHLHIVANHLNGTREQIATHHNYYVPQPQLPKTREEEDSSSTCSKQN
ncbi:hypothetical protein ACE6H2_023923 [Prunus campanulata]